MSKNKCLLINLSKSAPYTYIHTNIIHIRLAPTRSKSWNPQTLIARRSSYNALLLSPILRLAGNNWWLVVTTAMFPSSRCCYSCYYAPKLAHFIAIVSSATLLPRWNGDPSRRNSPIHHLDQLYYPPTTTRINVRYLLFNIIVIKD